VPVNRASKGGDTATDRYRRLIEESGIGLFQTNVDGSIDWLNAAAARTLGYESPQEFLETIRDIHQIYVDPSRRDDLLALLERDGAVTNFEYEAKRRDGGSRWISITARALYEEGHLEGFEGTFLDVTDKKLLEVATQSISSDLEPAAAVAHFAEVLRRAVPFTQLSLVVIEGDRYRRVVSLSGRGDIDPLPTGEWVPLEGNSVEMVVRSGVPAVVDDTADARWPFDLVLHEAGVRSYAIFPLVDQEGVFATFNLGRAEKGGFDADVLSLVGILISAATQAVKNILLFEQQREAVTRLEELNRMKHEFLAGVAHDLRNPVAVIGGAVQLLEDSWDVMPDEKKMEVVQTIRRSVTSLETSLQRDLDLVLLEQGELGYDIRPFELPTVLREVVDSWASSATTRTFDLQVDPGLPAALGDPHRQGQIIHNLLSNAVKFSPKGSAVKIEATAGSDEIVVSVVNEGSIESGDHDRLFQRMSRLSSNKPGTGLGLYICRLMVEAQGGRIWLDREATEGVRFSYTVPLSNKGGE
jgi:PAS domain S-box-containing protein